MPATAVPGFPLSPTGIFTLYLLTAPGSRKGVAEGAQGDITVGLRG